MLLALLLLAASAAASPLPLAFDDLPRLVAERNEEARGSRTLAEAARRRTGHLGRSWLPSAEAAAGGEGFQTGPYSPRAQPYGSLDASLNLYRGGRDAAEERLRRARASSAEAESASALASELEAARGGYWELVSTWELLGIVRDAADDNDRHLELAERRIRAGLATEADRLEFRIQRAVLEEEAESLRHEAQLIQLDLAPRLGRPPGTDFAVSTSVPHDHHDALLQAREAVPPELAALRASESAAAAMGESAARWWAPALDLYGGYALYTLRERDYLPRGPRDDRFAGARLRLPLFDGRQGRAQAASLELSREGYALRARQAGLAYRAAVERAKEELRHLHELVHNSEERIAQGRRYLAVVLDEYGRGVKNSVDVLGAAQRLLAFRRQDAERRRDYALAQARLLRLLGR